MKEILEKIESATFKDVDDLYENRQEIRENFQLFDIDTKKVYKWYFFYELCLLKNPLKGLLWEYLNKEIDENMIDITLSIEYESFCIKRDNLFKSHN